MITLRHEINRVLIDIDTQQDFFVAGGAASVSNHRQLLAGIRRVMAAVRLKRIPVISTAQVYESTCHCPGYCLTGTKGLKKLRYTVRNNHLCYQASDSTDLPYDLLKYYDQVIFCKRGKDPFVEPRLDRMLSQLKADEFFLIGATAEGAVKETALGLLARGKHVTVLTDVIGVRNKIAAQRAFRQMAAKGAVLAKSTQLIGASVLRKNHVCSCRYCRETAVTH